MVEYKSDSNLNVTHTSDTNSNISPSSPGFNEKNNKTLTIPTLQG